MEGWPSGNGTGLLNRGWGWRPTRVRSARLPLMEDKPALTWCKRFAWPSDKRPDQVQLLGSGLRRDSSAGRAPASYAGGRGVGTLSRYQGAVAKLVTAPVLYAGDVQVQALPALRGGSHAAQTGLWYSDRGPLTQRQSTGLLIRAFRVRAPGGLHKRH